MRRITWQIALLALALAPALLAQGPPDESAAERTAMKRLAFMVGEWEGDAWVQTGPGQRKQLRQTESVRYALDGVILLVEGKGYEKADDGSMGPLVFNAYGIVSWDGSAGYALRSWLASGQEGARALEVSDSGFVWIQEVPRGKTRYTMRLTPAGEWHEIGEYTPDGQRWLPILEMRLIRRP